MLFKRKKTTFISHFIEDDQTIFSLFSPNCEQLFRFLSCVIFTNDTNVYIQRDQFVSPGKDICSPRTLNGSAVTIFSPVAIINIHCFPSIIPIRRSESYILHCSDRRNKEMAPFGSLMYAGSSLICKLISQEGCGKALDLTLKLYR